MRLVPASPEAEKALPGGELRIRTFPFRIGRASTAAESEQNPPDLVLNDRAPHNVSRRHLSLSSIRAQAMSASAIPIMSALELLSPAACGKSLENSIRADWSHSGKFAASRRTTVCG